MDRFLTENLILEEEGSLSASALEDYRLELIDYGIKNQKFSGTQEVTIPVERDRLYDYDRVYVDFTIAFDSPSVASITLSDSSCHYVTTSRNSNKVHVRLRLPRRTCHEIRIRSTAGTFSGKVKNIRFYGAASVSAAETGAEVDFSTPGRDTRVDGTVTNTVDGTLMVSIPYEDGWYATVDGRETEILRADYGFMALKLPAGKHEITFEYHAPGLNTGILLSLIGWAVFLAGAALRQYQLHKKH